MEKQKIEIFIVEDNNLFSLALKADIETAFPDQHVRIQAFETGEACRKKFKEVKPQVVILDYNLNSKHHEAENGLKILEWIKNENPETCVIMLTSIDDVDVAFRSFKHGASDYVVKTETQFKKINYSLANLFKMMEAKREAIKYKRRVNLVSLCFAVIIAAVIAVQIFRPAFLIS